MPTKPRANFAKKQALIDHDNKKYHVVIKWADNETSTYDLAELPDSIRYTMMVHGGKQKLGDGYNRATTVVEARAIANQTWDRLKSGDWNAAGGVLVIPDEYIIKAIAFLKQKDFDQVKVTYDALPEERQTAIKADNAVITKAKAIMAEEAASKSSTKDELGEF